jgi:hypothetical protein
MTWTKGQRVKFFSAEKMDDVEGSVFDVNGTAVFILWDDEDFVRVYDHDAPQLQHVEAL